MIKAEHQTIIVLDFGGQYKELIARRVRECNVYSEIRSGNMSADELRKIAPIGIILTGGPSSVYNEDAPKCDCEIFKLGIPILGICYGHQLMSYTLGGTVAPSGFKEYGKIPVNINTDSLLFKDLPKEQMTLMSHTDAVVKLADGFVGTACSKNCNNAAVENREMKFYGLQFHPEVDETKFGKKIIRNFLYNVCNATGDYTMDNYIKTQIQLIRDRVGNGRVLLGLSGGVDSSVCAALLSKAIPNQLFCIFVDHGLMRLNEGDEIEEEFSNRDLHFIRVNAEERFLKVLKGVIDPEQKRKIIGKEFIEVFRDEAAKLGNIQFLAQGTIYPDVIESGLGKGATIKSHHNVGGLPKDIGFEGIIEPLRGLFKDEVRVIGRKLKLSTKLVERQPFPGPGLGIRIIGEITREKLDTLRAADAIFREEVKDSHLRLHQYFAVLTNVRSVGVMGDGRTYDYTLALRAINTSDFMTCTYAKIPHKILEHIASRIINEVNGINRVVYDITGKPPATIEWE